MSKLGRNMRYASLSSFQSIFSCEWCDSPHFLPSISNARIAWSNFSSMGRKRNTSHLNFQFVEILSSFIWKKALCSSLGEIETSNSSSFWNFLLSSRDARNRVLKLVTRNRCDFSCSNLTFMVPYLVYYWTAVACIVL